MAGLVLDGLHVIAVNTARPARISESSKILPKMHPQPSLMSCQSFKVNEMAERYKQLLKTGMQYQKDCPVLLAASALLLDTQRNMFALN